MRIPHYALALILAAGCSETATPAQRDAAADASADASATDPLSMPALPTLASKDFETSASCKPCHPRHVAEWSGSRHGAAITDAVFQALVLARQKARDGREDRFCTQCHSAIGVRSAEIKPGFSFSGLSDVAREGVTCVTCHGSTGVVRPYNAGLDLSSDHAWRSNLQGANPGKAHGQTAAPFMQSAEFCASCHDVRELNGLALERPFQEWQDSAASSAPSMQTCQDCHMPRYDGQAAKDGPQRTGLHTHRFVGLDPPGAVTATGHEYQADFAANLDALLKSSASLHIGHGPAQPGQTLDATVTIENRIAGHSLPTGTTFVRQCWIELIATDASGKVIYETGTLDANDDLRDRWSQLAPYGDADLVTLSSQLLDKNGVPTLFPWFAVEHHRNALRAGETKTWTYFVPLPVGVKGPVQLSARLRIRTYPPFLFRLLGAAALLPTIRTYDLASDVTAVAP